MTGRHRRAWALGVGACLSLLVAPRPAAAVCTNCGGTTVSGPVTALLMGGVLAFFVLVVYVASAPTRAVVRREREVAAAAGRAASEDPAFGESRVRAAAARLFRERHAGALKGTLRVRYIALDRPAGRVGVQIASGPVEEYWTLVRHDDGWAPETIEDRKARKQMLARSILA